MKVSTLHAKMPHALTAAMFLWLLSNCEHCETNEEEIITCSFSKKMTAFEDILNSHCKSATLCCLEHQWWRCVKDFCETTFWINLNCQKDFRLEFLSVKLHLKSVWAKWLILSPLNFFLDEEHLRANHNKCVTSDSSSADRKTSHQFQPWHLQAFLSYINQCTKMLCHSSHVRQIDKLQQLPKKIRHNFDSTTAKKNQAIWMSLWSSGSRDLWSNAQNDFISNSDICISG